MSDNLGLPISYDLAYYQTDSIGPQDADILIQLKPEHQPTAIYEGRIRELMQRQFPKVQAYFQAADIISQVLNFGLPAAIDAQVSGKQVADGSHAAMLQAKATYQQLLALQSYEIITAPFDGMVRLVTSTRAR